MPNYELSGMQKPPVIILSHDCDHLRGNDITTQAIRAIRIFLPLLKLRPPKVDNIWWIIRNTITPQRFYFDNITGMIDLERCFGYRSMFYILNGSRGRFGARSGFGLVPKLIESIPPGWDFGIHYNYDTFLNKKAFKQQLDQLKNETGSKITSGRAHYLRFNPEQSFSFLRNFGIRIDESSGYADRIGFRNGIAGCFQVFDIKSNKMIDIWELPMTIMDGVLVRQYGNGYLNRFTKILFHVSRIGRALSIVFHPGEFFNPENRPLLDAYHQMLVRCYKIGAVSSTALEMVDALK
jgi:hypothetical protein